MSALRLRLKLIAGHGSPATADFFLRMHVGTMTSTNGTPLDASQWSSKHSLGTSSGWFRECQWQRRVGLLLVAVAVLAAEVALLISEFVLDSTAVSSCRVVGALETSGSSWDPGGVGKES